MKKISSLFLITVFIASCDGGIGSGFITKLIPKIFFQATSLNVEVGESITLTWSTEDANTCSASGSWSGTKATSGSETIVVNVPGNNEFLLSCRGKSSEFAIASLVVEGQRFFAGRVIDGYIRGATVFIDRNDNFLKDEDEPFTSTDNDGFFQLQYNDGNLISEGGFDLETGNPIDILMLSLPLAGYTELKTITPLTSLLGYMERPTTLNAALGIDPSIDLTNTDPVALKDSGPVYTHIYEKGNQIAMFALGLQIYINEFSNTTDTSENAFASIASILEQKYADSNEVVNIETESFIDSVINHFINHQTANKGILEPSNASVTNLKHILSAFLPVLEVKATDNLTHALIDFATSTFFSDLKQTATGSLDDATLDLYQTDLLNYIAFDQNVDADGLLPNPELILDTDGTGSVGQLVDNVIEEEASSSNVMVTSYDLITADASLPVNLTNMVNNYDGSFTVDVLANPSVFSYPGLSGMDLSFGFNNNVTMTAEAFNLTIDGHTLINDSKPDSLRVIWISGDGTNTLESNKIGTLTFIPEASSSQPTINVKTVFYGGKINDIDSKVSLPDESRYTFTSFEKEILNTSSG